MNTPITRVSLRRRGVSFTAIAAASALFILFLLLGFSLSHPFVGSFDQTVGESVRSLKHHALDLTAKGFDILGSTVGFAALALVLIIIFLISRKGRDALFLLLAAAGAWGLNTIAKTFFARPRPELEALFEADGFSYPSGNATIGFALIAMAAYIMISRVKAPAAKTIIFAIAFILIGGIGVFRIYAGVHYPTDIIGGYLAGGAYFIILVSFWWRRTA